MQKSKIIFQLALAVLIFVATAHGVSAASLQFDPTTKSVGKGEQFTIKVEIDSGTNEILATDAKINYDKTLLEIVKIENGEYFTTLGKADYTTNEGEIYIAGIVDDPGDFKKGTGTVAIVTFKSLNADGTATLSYVCTPGETGEDSNIANNDFDATDVINCSENGSSRITIGGGGSSTTTPTPTGSTTSAPTSTPAPTVSSLPETGLFESATSMGIMLPLSVLAVLIGLAVKFFLR